MVAFEQGSGAEASRKRVVMMSTFRSPVSIGEFAVLCTVRAEAERVLQASPVAGEAPAKAEGAKMERNRAIHECIPAFRYKGAPHQGNLTVRMDAAPEPTKQALT
jgi:hypothetical protein